MHNKQLWKRKQTKLRIRQLLAPHSHKKQCHSTHRANPCALEKVNKHKMRTCVETEQLSESLCQILHIKSSFEQHSVAAPLIKPALSESADCFAYYEVFTCWMCSTSNSSAPLFLLSALLISYYYYVLTVL